MTEEEKITIQGMTEKKANETMDKFLGSSDFNGTVSKSQIEPKINAANIVNKQQSKSTTTTSSFVRGIQNRTINPLPPLPSFPWLTNKPPLPPFTSLKPPEIKDNTRKCNIPNSIKSSSYKEPSSASCKTTHESSVNNLTSELTKENCVSHDIQAKEPKMECKEVPSPDATKLDSMEIDFTSVSIVKKSIISTPDVNSESMEIDSTSISDVEKSSITNISCVKSESMEVTSISDIINIPECKENDSTPISNVGKYDKSITDMKMDEFNIENNSNGILFKDTDVNMTSPIEQSLPKNLPSLPTKVLLYEQGSCDTHNDNKSPTVVHCVKESKRKKRSEKSNSDQKSLFCDSNTNSVLMQVPKRVDTECTSEYNRLPNKRVIPKYGTAEDKDDIDYEYLRNIMPKSSSIHHRERGRYHHKKRYLEHKLRDKPPNISTKYNICGVIDAHMSTILDPRLRNKSYKSFDFDENDEQKPENHLRNTKGSKSKHDFSKRSKDNDKSSSLKDCRTRIDDRDSRKSASTRDTDKVCKTSSRNNWTSESDSDMERESGECSSTSSDSDSSPNSSEDDSDTDSTDDFYGTYRKVYKDIKNKEISISSHGEQSHRIRSNSYQKEQSDNHLGSVERDSPALSICSKGSGKTIPLQKRLGLSPEGSLHNFDLNSNSSEDRSNSPNKPRKGPHTPDYPYEKSPIPIINETEAVTQEDQSGRNATPDTLYQKENTDSKNMPFTTIHKTISRNSVAHNPEIPITVKRRGSTDLFKQPINRDIKSKLTLNKNIHHPSGVVKDINVTKSPFRSNLDTRIKNLFGIKHSSSEESPVKADPSVPKPKIAQPLRQTPSPFRSRNTYLHWFKETYQFKKLGTNNEYADPNKRMKIGIQIKEYNESSSSDEEPTESIRTFQDLGISPPRSNRVQQILNCEDDLIHPNLIPYSVKGKPPDSILNNVIKMNMSANSELELNCSSNEQATHNDTANENITDFVVKRLLAELKSSIKRSITDDAIDHIMNTDENIKRFKVK